MGRALAVALALARSFAFFVFRREPRLFVYPRFWAEEGTFYFRAALERGFFESLLNPFPVQYGPYLLFSKMLLAGPQEFRVSKGAF